MGVPEVEGASPEAELSFPDTGQGDRTLVTTIPAPSTGRAPSRSAPECARRGTKWPIRVGRPFDLTASPAPRRLAIRNTPAAPVATTYPAAGGPHARPWIDSAPPHRPHVVRRGLRRQQPDAAVHQPGRHLLARLVRFRRAGPAADGPRRDRELYAHRHQLHPVPDGPGAGHAERHRHLLALGVTVE